MSTETGVFTTLHRVRKLIQDELHAEQNRHQNWPEHDTDSYQTGLRTALHIIDKEMKEAADGLMGQINKEMESIV
jgi:hypothetical protein